MSNKHCCQSMQRQVESICVQHKHRNECPDAIIEYSEQFNEYGVVVHDGGTSSIAITFCPWCGTKLPSSLRNRWFEELEALGISDPLSQAIPEKYKSSAWYRDA